MEHRSIRGNKHLFAHLTIALCTEHDLDTNNRHIQGHAGNLGCPRQLSYFYAPFNLNKLNPSLVIYQLEWQIQRI